MYNRIFLFNFYKWVYFIWANKLFYLVIYYYLFFFLYFKFMFLFYYMPFIMIWWHWNWLRCDYLMQLLHLIDKQSINSLMKTRSLNTLTPAKERWTKHKEDESAIGQVRLIILYPIHQRTWCMTLVKFIALMITEWIFYLLFYRERKCI